MEPVVLKQPSYTWQSIMKLAVQLYLDQAVSAHRATTSIIGQGHLNETPSRVVEAFTAYVRGCTINPASFLGKQFEAATYDEMVHIRSIRVMSMCAHHLCPIVGKAHFSYIPGKYIVGLSKIPRMVDALARRPQVQENLTEQIVDIFQSTVFPKGCAVSVRAYHFCMLSRGVEEPFSFTETTALRGCFKDNEATRAEFLQSVDRNEPVFP